MRRGAIAGAAILAVLTGCDPAERRAESAERQYAMVVSADGGDWDARCAAARKVSAAWLEAEDEGKYELADIRAGLDCNRAEMTKEGISR